MSLTESEGLGQEAHLDSALRWCQEGTEAFWNVLLPWTDAIFTPHTYSSGCTCVTYIHSAKHKQLIFIPVLIRLSGALIWKAPGQAQLRLPGTGTLPALFLPHGGNLVPSDQNYRKTEAGLPRLPHMLPGFVYFFFINSHHF